jgi:ABC-type spermidine/putrescine transport system permease subunit II
MLRDLIALPAFYLVSRAPLVAEVVVGVGFLLLLSDQGMPLTSSVTVLAVALLGVLAVHLATSARMLRTTDGGRRAIEDACWEASERIADWAGWEFTETTDTARD